MRIGLKSKIWLSICSIVFTFTFFSYYYFPLKQEKLLVDNYNSEVQNLANTVALGVKISLKNQDFEGVQDAMAHVKDDSRLQFVSLLSYDTIWDNPKKYHIRKMVVNTVPETRRPEPEMQSNDSVIVKRTEFTTASMSGTIMLGLNTKAIMESKKRIGITALTVSSVIFLIGILIGFMLARHISRPVKALRNAAEKVGEGDLNQQITRINKDEIGDLSVAFNKMVGDLSRARHELSEQKKLIEEKHEEIQEKHREVLHSIEYARRIQGSILPPQKKVKQYLEDSFILYMPKDIVAGDFYWMAEIEGEVLFAAGDCTGHGVPGAMVSVVCSNALNKAVNEMNIHQPARILEKVCELVMAGFHRNKSEDEDYLLDGMDISLCRLDVKTRRLEWAGAHNPLWVIRQTSESPEIIEIKADKQSVGNSIKPFQNHEIQLEAGDCLYLFSDGYTDQFGGSEDKKFNKKRFRELLLSIQSESLPVQKDILIQRHAEWKGKSGQVDDICVFGIRV